MKLSSNMSDTDLLALMPSLVLRERSCVADVIEHLVEIDRRRLYLDQACRSLSSYCMERLNYSEDEAVKRVRVARLVARLPHVLDELRAGTIHLTGLFLLAQHLTEDNCDAWLARARGKSKREIEQLIVCEVPKPDAPAHLARVPEQLAMPGAKSTCPGPTPSMPSPGKLKPLSAEHWSVQFTAGAELHSKIELAKELLSHAVPSGDLATIFERALDTLIEQQLKRKLGTGSMRKRRSLKPGSRHVPVEVARVVWQRDGGQCTFIDAQGRRCSSRRFLALEHRRPFALGGPPTADNLCLLCQAHNLYTARQVFGEGSAVRLGPSAKDDVEVIFAKLGTGLRSMGFATPEVRCALAKLRSAAAGRDLESLLRAALELLVPAPPQNV